MRLESWFITSPDNSQQQVLKQDIKTNLCVNGSAGSGKTNMAIYRANQAMNDKFAIIVYNIALMKMVRFGLSELGLDSDRVIYEYSWNNRGISVSGDVFCFREKDNKIDRNMIILVNNNKIEYFLHCNVYDKYIKEKNYRNFKISKSSEDLNVSIDFNDWVSDEFYRAFGRRSNWFKKVEISKYEFNANSKDVEFVTSGFLYKEKGQIDYLIIDEGQDFSINQYKNDFIPQANKSITVLGDSNQLIYANKGTKMNQISKSLSYKTLDLEYNYRIPKTIARVAEKIATPHLDLMSKNKKNGGNSLDPVFKKPTIIKCKNEKEEIDYIINKINIESLDDVGILLKDNKQVIKVYNYLKEKNIDVQVRFNENIPENIMHGRYPQFRTFDTLDFTNNDLPCLLTYHSAKGTEFDNVFIPFADNDMKLNRNPFYVAITRSNRNLDLSYSRKLTHLMDNVNPLHYNHIKI